MSCYQYIIEDQDGNEVTMIHQDDLETPITGDSIKAVLDSFIDTTDLGHTCAEMLQEFNDESSEFYGYKIIKLRLDKVDFDDEDLAVINKLMTDITDEYGEVPEALLSTLRHTISAMYELLENPEAKIRQTKLRLWMNNLKCWLPEELDKLKKD